MTGSEVKVKPWGKVDKTALNTLVVDGLVDIEDTSNSVRKQFFPHRKLRNFQRNSAKFSVVLGSDS